MKFARYLASHRIDEWRNGYVDVSSAFLDLFLERQENAI